MRGLLWADDYFPGSGFPTAKSNWTSDWQVYGARTLYLGCKYYYSFRLQKSSMFQHVCNAALGSRNRSPADWGFKCFAIHACFTGYCVRYSGEDTWIECLVILVVAEWAYDDIRDREIWTGVARYWYFKAPNKGSTIGRLYHHLGILARRSTFQQHFSHSSHGIFPDSGR